MCGCGFLASGFSCYGILNGVVLTVEAEIQRGGARIPVAVAFSGSGGSRKLIVKVFHAKQPSSSFKL